NVLLSHIRVIITHSLRRVFLRLSFFFNDTATTEIYTLSLHDALPISGYPRCGSLASTGLPVAVRAPLTTQLLLPAAVGGGAGRTDRKSTRLNSSHVKISYAVFCLKKKKKKQKT